MRAESLRREERKEIETQRNPKLGSTMKPTKSRETQACRRWVSSERIGRRRGSKVWVGGVDQRLGSTWDFDGVGQQWVGDVKAGGNELRVQSELRVRARVSHGWLKRIETKLTNKQYFNWVENEKVFFQLSATVHSHMQLCTVARQVKNIPIPSLLQHSF